MKLIPSLAIAILPLGAGSFAIGQYEGEIEVPETILEAIRDNQERSKETANEVTVVLPPPAADASSEDPENPEGLAADADPEQVRPDENVAAIPESETGVEVAAGEPSSQGPEVRVQPLRDLAGRTISPDEVTISTPFAAKPLGTPAPGWKLVSSPQAPRFTQNVEIAPGTWLTLSIRPHVLAPDADGRTAFQIQEPGFDSKQGYRQSATVGASLASSIERLESDSLTLGKVIADLEQILISLPKSDN